MTVDEARREMDRRVAAQPKIDGVLCPLHVGGVQMDPVGAGVFECPSCGRSAIVQVWWQDGDLVWGDP